MKLRRAWGRLCGRLFGPHCLFGLFGLFGLIGAFGGMPSAAAAAPAPIRLTGHYAWRTDNTSRSLHGDAVCFFPDALSAAYLPRPQGDRRLAWFCFSNRERAAQLLALPAAAPACGVSGPAAVTVSGYRVATGEGEDTDTAHLLWARPGREATTLVCSD